jgi:hypothetical protein
LLEVSDMADDDDKTEAFISAGSEIAGGVTGAAIGFLTAGPGGALAGAAAGPLVARVVKRTCSEIYERVTGHRQKARGGLTAGYAIINIAARIKAGECIRDDGFFDAGAERSSAEEILEGVIIKSSNEHEEKKAKFYATIFATAAFDARFTAEALNHFLALAERLTYRQLCFLNLFSRPQPISLPNYDLRAIDAKPLNWETTAELYEIFDLFRIGLVHRYETGSDAVEPAKLHGIAEATIGYSLRDNGSYTMILGIEDINPCQMVRSEMGNRLYYLMQLKDLSIDDIQRAAEPLLRGSYEN